MQGVTEGLPENNEPVQGAQEYKFLTNELIPLQHPVGELIGDAISPASGNGGSLLPAFCRAYVRESGREVVAISAARGSTGLSDWQEGTERFSIVVEKVLKGIEKVKNTHKVERIYYVWLQGESDGRRATGENEYLQGLIRYKNALKKECGIEKFGIIKVGYFVTAFKEDINSETYKPRRMQEEAVMRAQERATREDEDFVMLTRICTELSLQSEYINPNAGGHYNNKAMELIGEVAGKALAKEEK